MRKFTDLNWDAFRNADQVLDLVNVFNYVYEDEVKKRPEYRVVSAHEYLQEVMKIKSVISRQAAAIALVNAANIMRY